MSSHDAVTLTAALTSLDEPLACALPVSGFVRTSDRAPACAVRESVASLVSDRALCEDVATCSSATP
jgi:hypothetical protein